MNMQHYNVMRVSTAEHVVGWLNYFTLYLFKFLNNLPCFWWSKWDQRNIPLVSANKPLHLELQLRWKMNTTPLSATHGSQSLAQLASQRRFEASCIVYDRTFMLWRNILFHYQQIMHLTVSGIWIVNAMFFLFFFLNKPTSLPFQPGQCRSFKQRPMRASLKLDMWKRQTIPYEGFVQPDLRD